MRKLGVWMVKLLNKAVLDVISVIENSKDYQKCLELKDSMKKNPKLMKLIDDLRNAEKKYVRSEYQNKEEVTTLEEQLNQIPIYVIYMQHLEKVNQMISYVEEDLNDYFFKLFN